MTTEERLLDVTPSATAFDPRAAEGPPAQARAVVVGGGIIGASVALHLARLGWTDTVVLERSQVSSGTSWHAAGLMTRTRGTHAQTELASYSRDFYRELAALSGVDVGYYQSGSRPSLAQTAERVTELGYTLEMARHHDQAVRWLEPSELSGLSPLIAPDGVLSAVYFEDDATVNPGVAAFAVAKAATDLGVRVFEDLRRDRLPPGRRPGRRGRDQQRPHRVRGGGHSCRPLVPRARLARRRPARPAPGRAHVGADGAHPRLLARSADRARPRRALLRAALSRRARHRRFRAGRQAARSLFDPAGLRLRRVRAGRRYFEAPLAKARERIPALRDAAFAHFLNAPESFTPDANFLLGETAEVAGLFVAAGLNSQGIIFGTGIGMALAEWIAEGAPTIDAAEVDVRRFAAVQSNADYLFERTREGLGWLYAMHWPFLQPETARGLRKVPLYDALSGAGACFGEAAGWERPNWYAPPGERPEYAYSYGRQNWFGAVAGEHRAAP